MKQSPARRDGGREGARDGGALLAAIRQSSVVFIIYTVHHCSWGYDHFCIDGRGLWKSLAVHRWSHVDGGHTLFGFYFCVDYTFPSGGCDFTEL